MSGMVKLPKKGNEKNELAKLDTWRQLETFLRAVFKSSEDSIGNTQIENPKFNLK